MKTIGDAGELAVVERIKKFLPEHSDILVGAGDDCAVVRCVDSETDLVLTSDPVIEGIHFTSDTDRSRMGCEHCYKVFENELQPMLAMMHKNFQHKGKVPQNAKVAISVERLEQDLNAAIEVQDFEKAAVIRDNIAIIKN